MLESSTPGRKSSDLEAPPSTSSPNPAPHALLSELPTIVIQPSGSRVGLQLPELWSYRELLYFLMWRDIRVRYKQTVLGAAWAIIQPLATMVLATLIFGRLAGLGAKTGAVPYSLFVLAGLVLWTFFSTAVTNSGGSLIGSANLLTKIYFPRLIIPAAAVGACTIDLVVSFAVLAALLLWNGFSPGAGWLLIPFLAILTALLALGVGTLVAALSVKYRDIHRALPFVISLGIYAAPIFWAPEMFGGTAAFSIGRWEKILALNPLGGILGAFRAALFGHAIPWGALGFSILFTLGLLVFAAYTFRRLEKNFADVI